MTIKLYTAYHTAYPLPSAPFLVPIQVGAELSPERIPGAIPDNTGINISEKNRSYCELTAQYWVWKNDTADYMGFFHYRRFLSFSKYSLPYVLEKNMDAKTLRRHGYDPENIRKIIAAHDLIAPKAEEMHQTVYDYYCLTPNERKQDIDLVKLIMAESYPQYLQAMEIYFSQTKMYFCNIYIMKRELFHEYCTFLFGILEKYEQLCDKTGYTAQEMRAEGFLAERIFGVFYTHLKLTRKDLKIAELTRIDFLTGKEKLGKNRFVFKLFPPGSRRRFLLKKMTGMTNNRQ